MRPRKGQPYYTAYEERYRAIYGQGITHWSAFPAELDAVAADVNAFLVDFSLTPEATPRIVEFGCGEGFVGVWLAERGFDYTGLDIAPSALEKARARLARFGAKARVRQADLTDLKDLSADFFDAAVDVSTLHMLVVDRDRSAYLKEAFRLLKPGAPVLFCHEAFRAGAADEPVTGYEQWLRLSGTDVDTPVEREAWEDGRPVRIRLPLIAARGRSEEQYHREVEVAGFSYLGGTGSADENWMTFLARKP